MCGVLLFSRQDMERDVQMSHLGGVDEAGIAMNNVIYTRVISMQYTSSEELNHCVFMLGQRRRC